MKNKLHPVEKFLAEYDSEAGVVECATVRYAVRRLVRELAEIGAQETDESDGRPDDVRAAILGPLAKRRKEKP